MTLYESTTTATPRTQQKANNDGSASNRRRGHPSTSRLKTSIQPSSYWPCGDDRVRWRPFEGVATSSHVEGPVCGSTTSLGTTNSNMGRPRVLPTPTKKPLQDRTIRRPTETVSPDSAHHQTRRRQVNPRRIRLTYRRRSHPRRQRRSEDGRDGHSSTSR